MPRVKKPAKVKEPIRLRMKELAKWKQKVCIWISIGTANGRMSI